MEGQISETTKQRKQVYERYTRLTARRDEIVELQSRFGLLDAQYTNDIKRLVAIEESGQFFVLRDPMPCPLCGALPEEQHHDSTCDGNVVAVTQAAAAEIAKIKLLQTELQETVTALNTEHTEIVRGRRTLEVELRGFQQQIDAALSPEFGAVRESYEQLIERRAAVRQAAILYKKLLSARRRLEEPVSPPETPEPGGNGSDVEQYISKSILRNFSKTVERILREWHFPNATDVYFDEVTRDIVIDGRPRGSRGSGLCAITYSAFIIGLFDYCRSRKMPTPDLSFSTRLTCLQRTEGRRRRHRRHNLKLRFSRTPTAPFGRSAGFRRGQHRTACVLPGYGSPVHSKPGYTTLRTFSAHPEGLDLTNRHLFVTYTNSEVIARPFANRDSTFVSDGSTLLQSPHNDLADLIGDCISGRKGCSLTGPEA